MNKRDISQRINQWLDEAPGQIFKKGKWKFWFPLVIGATFLNGLLTAWIFGFAGAQVWLAFIVATMGALLCWLSVGNLHYSDSEDERLARGVAALDSITLVFVIGHFCFLLWAFGHLMTLRSAESEYRAQAESFNVRAENIQADNVKIAEAGVKIAEAGVKAENLRRRTAYQQRRAAEAGARIAVTRSSGALFPAISTAPVEMERPKAPEQSSTAFLARWDKWIRIANFGELILAAITLIYIRNRSAKFNAQGASKGVATLSQRQFAPQAALRQESHQKTASVATRGRNKALLALREHLRVLAFPYPGRWFKADLRDSGGVWIRMCERNDEGGEVTIAKTCQSDKLLAAVNRPDFRERLIAELKHQQFPLE